MSDYNTTNPFNESEKNEREDTYKKKVFDPKIYLNVKLADDESEREVTVRILPAQPGSEKISTDIKIHSMKVPTEVAKSGFKAFTCLNDPHVTDEKDERGCPFCNMFNQYRDDAKSLKDKDGNIIDVTAWKSLWKEAYKYQPKIAHIVRVIDRDHEDEGVKFWRFNEWDNGKGCYDYLKEIYKSYNESAAKKAYKNENGKLPTKEQLEEYMSVVTLDKDGNEKKHVKCFYNVFNLDDGHDIKLTLTKGENTKDRTEIKIMADVDETPLSEDPEQVSAWINDAKSWDDAYVVKNYDYLDVVVNGGIPVWSREQGKFVAKTEQQQIEANAEREAAAAILNGGQTSTETEADDLPF